MLLYQNTKKTINSRNVFKKLLLYKLMLKSRFQKHLLNFKTERTSNRNIHDFELILKLIISEVKPTFYCILLQSCLFYQLSSSPPWHSSQAIVQPLAVSNRRGIDQCISQSAAWEQQSDWKSQSIITASSLNFFKHSVMSKCRIWNECLQPWQKSKYVQQKM